jgi:hypothetical protein
MRKIISKSDEKKKKKRNQIILSLILVIVISFSTLGYAFRGGSGEVKNIEYNGIKFAQQNGFWIANNQGLRLILKYNPYEVNKTETEPNTIENYYNKPLYIYSEDSEASYEIYNNFENIVQRIQQACLKENNCEDDLPIKTCEENFIIITENATAGVRKDNNCLFIDGSKAELAKITDGVLLKIFKIEQ